jgi:ABC-type dipeptide/oligopeptide/nickel transport system permease subunit
VSGADITAELSLPATERRRLTGRLLRQPTVALGALIVAVALVAAVFGPLLAPNSPNAIDPAHIFASPSGSHLLGTDNLGRDEFSRVLYGARISVLTSVAVSAAILLVGVAVGALSGLAGGFVDGLIMRVVDLLLAFPGLLLALAVAGVLGPSLLHLAIAMAAVWWVEYARLVRGLVLSVREEPYVEAARALGLPGFRIATHHVLPNVFPAVMVLATIQTGRLLLALAALSFLGLGVQPPTPEWGAMLNDAKDYLAPAPQLMVWPGVAITITALGFNLLGDGLRDLLDPTLRQ